MMRNSFLLKIFAFAALLGLAATPAAAEWLQQRVSRGNNVGLGLMTDWCTPMITASWTGNTIQFPKGSGNLVINDAWTIGMMTANDLDGDGVPEDTALLGSGGRDNMPSRCSIEAHDVLAALAASGAQMETASGARSGTGMARVWTSLDLDELADWPVEARDPHTESGTPILNGAETMFVHSGDVFNSWGAPLSGFYMGWSFYLLDFAESNNMVYVHQYIQNVSEYCKWNPAYGDPALYPNASGLWTDQSAPPHEGWTWHGMILFNNWRGMGFGSGSNLGWAYHPAKQINTLWSKSPTVSAWTPQEPPLLGMKVLKYPSLRDEEADLINIHTVSGTEFGFSGAGNLLAMGLSDAKIYRAVVNEAGLYSGQINPFTEEPATDGWPGILESRHDRYVKWIWGGSDNWNHYTFWGEMHMVAPRDTMNLDWVMIWSPTGVTPLVAPTYDIANIDDPMMQEAFAPQEHYANVAQTVYGGSFIVPETPVAPPLTIIPGNREVTITWSDINPKTPDSYYAFLQDNPGLDPDGVYREFDFEGYRLYRSFVGPNDSHSELIWESSVSGGDLSFYFNDKLDDDQPFFRMRNGMKVWYAVVPYDRNYDPSSGEMFSLPDPTTGKQWNRAGESGLYNVITRSDASNFKPASVSGISYVPRSGPGVTPIDAPTADLTGDGTGKLTQAPVYLAPQVGDISLVPVNSERITQDISVYLECTGLGWGGCVYPSSQRTFQLVEGSETGMPLVLDVRQRANPQSETFVFNGPVDSDGMNYAVSAEFLSLKQGDFRTSVYYNMETGGYTEANVSVFEGRCGTGRPFGSQPSILSFTKSAQITLTWKDAGGGNLTLEVQDATHGEAVPYGPYFDDLGWGFIQDGEWGRTKYKFEGTLIYELYLPREERTAIMSETFPADNTADFGIWLNGAVWRFESVGDGFTAMPAVGTVMTVDFCMGSWNGDQTVFTMNADPPWPGDKWQIDVTAMSMDPEDADLSKVKVVPNPYMATSFLDLSATQRRIEFINLPDKCTIRIYSLGGNLVNVLNHVGANRSGWGDYTDWDRLTQGVPKEFTGYDNHGGTEPWNLRNRFGQTVASGLYFFHVTDSRGETYTGKFYIIN